MNYAEEIERRRQILSGVEDSSISDEDSFNNESPNMMSVVWAAGKLAVSVYDLDTSIISILLDIVESAPDFMVLKLIYNQFKPRILIVSARQDERMLKVLRDLCSANLPSLEEESIDDLGQSRTKLIVLPGREFAPDSCKKRVRELALPYEISPNEDNDNVHKLFIFTLIPSASTIIVRALGALLKFLDKKGVDFQQVELNNGKVPVLDIKIISMDEIVIIDENAWNSLHIFHLDNHPSNYKAGTNSGSKEGVSLYGVLNKCASPQGSKFLRSMLLRPTRNKSILKRRHDVVDFFAKQINSEFVRNAIESLKGIKSFPKHLFKLSVMKTTVREWKDLYTSLYQCIILGDFCGSFTEQLELFTEITELTSKEEFRQVVSEIQKIIDFETSTTKGYIVTQSGIFEGLDRNKRQYACLPEIMTMIAAEEMNLLPEFVSQCSVVYFPEIGYLLSLSFDREITEEDLREIRDLEYQFSSNDVSYFKSARMKELDIILGDCQISILDIEISIVVNLTNFVLKRSELILKIGQLSSELDSLISLAQVAQTYNYVRPLIVDGHRKLKIVDGRHPLCELHTTFVANSTIFESDEKIIILTGPNASGKSIYLKQIGIIIIMALSGSFVPAASGTMIPTFDRICTRIQACETVVNGFSTFMIDLSQMSMALRNASENSLILIDEFGKGTADTDGLSLLAASFEEFISRDAACPRIFLSTHFFSLSNHLVESPQIKLQTMDYALENNIIVYLYKLRDGSCSTSFAHLVAESFEIDKNIVARTLVIEEAIKKQLDEHQIKPDEEKWGDEEELTNLAIDFFYCDLEDRSFLFNAEEIIANSIIESPVSRYFTNNDNEFSDLENLTSASQSTPILPLPDDEDSSSRYFSTTETSRDVEADNYMISSVNCSSASLPRTIFSNTKYTTNESNLLSTEIEVIEP